MMSAENNLHGADDELNSSGCADMPLEANRDQVTRFVDALLPYADEGTYVSLRSYHEGSNKVFSITPVALIHDHTGLIDTVCREIYKAANAPLPVVFCPPVATFWNDDPEERWRARQEDLRNGLALSVECDRQPLEARRILEALLGPATVVVRSGGIWLDPKTGEVQDKLHLHWRLTEPTRAAEDHAKLRLARQMATALAGADTSNVPIVHAIRWAGSWHRKQGPRLTQIVKLTESAEIELSDALELLEEAVRAAGIDTATAKAQGSPGSGRTDRRGTDQLVKDLLTGEIQHASIVGLAMRYLMGGMPDAQAVLTLRGFMEAIPEDRRSTAAEANRWQTRYDDIPRAVRTARAKLGRQSSASGTASTSHGPTVNGRPVAGPEGRCADTGPMPGQDNAPADDEPIRDRNARAAENGSAGEHSGQSTKDQAWTYEHFGAGADGEPIEFSDEALALEFTERHAEHLRFVPGWGKWLEWDGTRWAPDEINRVFMHGRTLCRAASERANDEIEDERSAAKIASRVASRGVVTSVVKLAEADPRHARAAAIWDADPWALNTPGGIVDLRTGALNRHDPRAHCTKLTAVAPAGDCPQWLNFLDEVTGHDPELQAYLRRIAGYFLTGSVKEHALFFIHGPGGNGKGVLINTITDISGDYATVASMDTFTASQTDRHPTDMAMLRGARLVTAQETEEGRCWAESKIKSLTGGDPVTARFMRQDFFTYQPTFKLVIVGNHRPGIRNVDDAMRRRLHLRGS